jgi:hypothetical protein
MRTASISLSLPSSHTYGIGRIVVCWANVELRLGQIAYEAAGIDRKRGRLAIREPRAKDYPAMIAELLCAQNIIFQSKLVKLGKGIEREADNRDALVHGRHRSCS